jgi:hypothetical protein
LDAVGRDCAAKNRLQENHDDGMQAKCSNGGEPGEPAIGPDQDSSDENGQDANGVVVHRHPVDDIVARVDTQQDFPASENRHAANEEGENGCNFIQGCAHFYSFCVKPV